MSCRQRDDHFTKKKIFFLKNGCEVILKKCNMTHIAFWFYTFENHCLLSNGAVILENVLLLALA